LKRIRIDLRRISDKASFHSVFAELFGFPQWYGRNMDAWNDCMGDLDDPDSGMTTVGAQPAEIVVFDLEHVDEFERRCPSLWKDLIDCAAFVNFARLEVGQPPVIAVAYYRQP
jgi:RNAse (barnase) inhibitor barstar